jgi:hypothetical protein
LRQWTAAFENASASEAFAKQLGTVLSSYLDTMALSRDAVDRGLAAANVPTRADLAALSARVDALTTALDAVLAALKATKKSKKNSKKKRKSKKSAAKGESH